MQNVYGVFGSGTTTISIVAPDCQMPNIVLGVVGNNEKIYRLWIEFIKPSRMSFFLQFLLQGFNK